MDLKDKRALITGGTSGMGIATALATSTSLPRTGVGRGGDAL